MFKNKIDTLISAVIMITILSGCASFMRDSTKTIAYSKATVETIAKAAKALHNQGIITPEELAEVRYLYEKGRDYNNTVIDLAILSINAGIRPEDDEDYTLAVGAYFEVVQELVNIGIKYGIIGNKEGTN